MSRKLHLTALEERAAPSATLVKDINRATDFGSMAALGSAILFVQSTPPTGAELWRTDGTPGGTSLVKDIVPGVKGSDPQFYQQVGGLLYFTITTANGGVALWRTDGTAVDTIFIKTIDPTAGGSIWINDTVEFHSELYFSIKYTDRPSQLWRTDGTAAGTKLIKSIGWSTSDDLNNPPSNPIAELTVVGDTLYFTAENRTEGESEQLWETDGTSGGTKELPYLVPGAVKGGPFHLAAFNGELYFTQWGEQIIGFNGITVGDELWRTDGTVDGTFLVKDINPGSKDSDPARLTVAGNTLYFTATNGSTANGIELWRTDGTSTGTTMVADIRPGTGSSNPLGNPGGALIPFNGKVYFTADDGTTGRELWFSDGSAGGTQRLKDINPGLPNASISDITVVNGALYFIADDGSTGAEVWKSDGTPGGTIRLIDLEPGAESSFPQGFVGLGSNVYWFANTVTQGQALWKTDGTPDNATMVLSTLGHPTGDSGEGPGVSFKGSNYFVADGRLWKTDGTPAGTVPVSGAGPILENDAQLTVFNSDIYFLAYSPTGVNNLWSFDGNTVTQVKDAAGDSPSDPNGFVVCGSRLFFRVDSTTQRNSELWVTDGTPTGTSSIKTALYPQNLTVFNGEVYFPAGDGCLWKSDGTPAGTVHVSDLVLTPNTLQQVGAELYFWGTDATNGTQIWKTDGTGPGTVRVTDLPQGVGANYDPFAVLNGNLYFFGGFASTTALWRLDVASGVAALVKKIPYPDWLYNTLFDVFNGNLYFLGYDAKHGAELWTSDGTADGTHLFVDIAPGTKSAFRVPVFGDPTEKFAPANANFQAVGNGFLFDATDGNQKTDGIENYSIWWSDGTPAGTRPILDGYLDNSYGSEFEGEAGSAPIFRAFTADLGSELWRYDPIVTKTDSYSLEDDLQLIVPATSGVLANDTDGTSRPASAILVNSPTHGWLTLQSDGSFTYQPFSGDFSGTDTFTYRAAGTIEQSSPTTVTIDVDLNNQPPIARDDAVTGRAGKAITIAVLANDSDPDHDSFVIDSFTQGSQGAVRLVGSQLRYTPHVAGALTDSFTYTIRDPRGAMATGAVTVNLIVATTPKILAVDLFPGVATNPVDLTKAHPSVLPFEQLSRVSITFSADVAIAADDLQLLGESGGFYTLSNFAYDAASRTASWSISTPAQALGNDRSRFLLDGSTTGVHDASGNPLGDRVWSIALLSGDFNGNGLVTSTDLSAIKRLVGKPASGRGLFADINGDGTIDAGDADLAAANLGKRLI
jgi:trimeric autotransporter adhesin